LMYYLVIRYALQGAIVSGIICLASSRTLGIIDKIKVDFASAATRCCWWWRWLLMQS
jgi:hypothetical protein